MNLYLWAHVDALRRYAPGMAFALAETVQGARELIIQSYRQYLQDASYYESEEVPRLVANLARELDAITPGVFVSPCGFFKLGGE